MKPYESVFIKIVMVAALLTVITGCVHHAGHPEQAQPPGTSTATPASASAPRESAAHTPAPAPVPDLLIENVHVFDVLTGTMSDPRTLVVQGDRISAVLPPDSAPAAAAERIDCSGAYALPGLFDCHTHLAQLDTEEGAGVEPGLEALAVHGITQVRDVGGPLDRLSDMKRRTDSGEITGPEIFFTGPMLEMSPLTWGAVNEELPGFTVAVDTVGDVDRIIPELAEKGACLVKTFNKFDPEVYRHLVEAAGRHGLRIVHDPGTPLFQMMPMDAAIELGITSIEHAKAPWPIVLTEELQIEHDTLIGPDVMPMVQAGFMSRVADLGLDAVDRSRLETLAASMKAKEVFLCPTLQILDIPAEEFVEMIMEQQGIEEMPEMMRAMILKNVKAMETFSLFFVTELAGSGVKMLVGQDGHEPDGTFAEMRWLRRCGLGEAEILKGATIYPAEWLGVDDRLGALGEEKQANILVVSNNPLEDISNTESRLLVVKEGKVIFRAIPGDADQP